MTSAPLPRAAAHRRTHAARKPLIGGLAAAGLLAGAWYATAGAATPAAPALKVTATAVTLPAKFPYLSAGYNNTREWTRTATAVAPNGTLRVAWPAADGVHVTPLTSAGKRAGGDAVVKGAKEVGGLVAHNDGFALLTRVADSNKWKETAAALVRFSGGKEAWRTKLTGTASKDTSPTLDGQLTWNGTKYGACFVVHGAGGFADGQLRRQAVVHRLQGREAQRRLGLGLLPQRGHRPARRGHRRLHLPLLRRLAFGSVRVDGHRRPGQRPRRAARAVLGGLLRRHVREPHR